MFKKAKVVMLPTEKATRIINDRGNLELIKNPQIANTINSIVTGFNLYIVIAEKFKVGDWIYNERRNFIGKVKYFDTNGVNLTTEKNINTELGLGYFIDVSSISDCKKVIATTDGDLVYEGFAPDNITVVWRHPFPKPSDFFIKKYCQRKGINEILVEYNMEYYADSTGFRSKYARDLYIEETGASHSCWTKDLGVKIAPDNTITIKKVQNQWSKQEISEKIYQFNKWRKKVGTLGQNEPELIQNWIDENF